jgi:hypothetical protein
VVDESGNVDTEKIVTVDYSMRKAAYTALTTLLKKNFPAALEEYKALPDDAARRRFMGTVLVDVESAGSTGFTTTERTYDSESDEDENWFTERELMGPLHYNDKDEGGVYTKNAIKGMLSRPCKHNAVLRAAGELEYRKVKDTKRRRKGKRQRSWGYDDDGGGSRGRQPRNWITSCRAQTPSQRLPNVLQPQRRHRARTSCKPRWLPWVARLRKRPRKQRPPTIWRRPCKSH